MDLFNKLRINSHAKLGVTDVMFRTKIVPILDFVDFLIINCGFKDEDFDSQENVIDLSMYLR